MKTRKFIFLDLFLLVVLLLTACSSQGGTQQPSTNPTIAASEPVMQNPSITATVDGLALIQEKLANHHGLDIILSAQKTREEWNATLDRMNSYGANISEAEKQVIIDYLLSR